MVPGKAKWGPSWPVTGGGSGIGAAPATPVVGGAQPYGGVSIGGAMAIAAFRPGTALPAIRTRPASPAAPTGNGQLGAQLHSKQQSPQLAWGGLGVAMGGAAGSSSRKVMVPGSPSGSYIGSQWPVAMGTIARPGSAGAVSTHSNSILDVLAAPTASPLASGARYPVAW